MPCARPITNSAGGCSPNTHWPIIEKGWKAILTALDDDGAVN